MDLFPDMPDSGWPERDPRFGEPDEGAGGSGPEDDEGPRFALLPPEDRVWRHPSETPPGGQPAVRAQPSRIGAHAATRTWPVAVVAGLVGALVASGMGVVVGWWPQRTTVIRTVLRSTPVVSLANTGTATANWSEIDDSVAPAVVTLTVDGASGPQQGSGLLMATGPGGTAYVVTDMSLFTFPDATGYIGSIRVTFLSGLTAKGKLVGQDPLSNLAVVVVSGVGSQATAAAGSVADLHDAQPVLAVGSRSLPLLSTGSVSGQDRSVPLAGGTDLDGLIAVTMPAIPPAAAGGPLLDQTGQVVGITVNVQPVDSADQQLSFAVPIDEAVNVVTALIDHRPVRHPWLGVTDTEDVPTAMAHQLGLSGGVQVGQVSPGGPAARVGIRVDDIVTSLGGKQVGSVGALVAMMDRLAPGQSVPVTYVHDGHARQVMAVVGTEPADA